MADNLTVLYALQALGFTSGIIGVVWVGMIPALPMKERLEKTMKYDVQRTIAVDIDEIIENDLEGFLDLIAERAFGTDCAQEINYKITGSPTEYTVQLAVSANVPEEEDYGV